MERQFDTYIYQSNVSSTTLRGLFYSRNICQDEDKVHMPIPQFANIKTSKDANGEETNWPDRGSFFIKRYHTTRTKYEYQFNRLKFDQYGHFYHC